VKNKILDVQDLYVSFNTYAGEIQAVRGVSFDIYEGETLAIVGESGCGKSVTAKSIMRLNPDSTSIYKKGKILLNGEDIIEKSEKEMRKIRGNKIGMIFQDPMTSINPTMTIGKQIMEGLKKHRKISSKNAKEKAIEMLKKVQIPNAEHRFNEYPHQFSGGMRQRVMIALALVCNPQVLIADEPTTALDVTIQAQILKLMKELQNEINTSIILITHDLGVVADMADRITVMYGGKIIEYGSREDIFYNSKHPYTWGLLKSVPRLDVKKEEELASIEGTPPDLLSPPKGCCFADRCEYAMRICREKMPDKFNIKEGHGAYCWLNHPNAPNINYDDTHDKIYNINEEIAAASTEKKSKQLRSKEKEILVSIKNLKKYFEIDKNLCLRAVDDVTIDIYKGETLGLVGESGCGKSTFGRTVLNIYDATSGSIEFQGKNICEMSKKEKREFDKRAQMIFQDPYASLNPRMLVSNIVAEGIDIYGLLKGKQRQEKIYELLELVGLNKEHLNRFPHEFSGGQRQRIGIARALALNPDFIVCDEPISALDVSVQAQVVNLLRNLQKQYGLTYLFIAHDLSMVRYISDRVAVMYLGEIVELASSDELYNNPSHPYTQALLSAIPIPDPKVQNVKKHIVLKGDVPSPINPPKGCKFVDRCQNARDICRRERPKLKEIEPGHFASCLF
jgi:peptide/nickel transport system ATP-binding protein